MTTAPKTTSSTTGASSTAAPITLALEPVYSLSLDLGGEPFSNALTDPSSREYINLEERVINTCSAIYKKEFGNKFGHCNVKKFSALPPTRATGTEAAIEVVFNRTTPIADLPQNNVIAEVLVKAVTNPNNTFNVSINPASIKVLAFKNRAAMIKGQLEPIFLRTFPSSFKTLEVVSFRSGSVINTIDLNFVSPFAPNNTQIASTLINAASSVSGFDIEGSSINVNGILSSGVSQKMSLVTASCLVLLSWLLSSQQ
ncbi:hypothetical protein PFLUV_G00162230 [Perca fluviatilis]|uniref:SEA domain-containing protein n=1 Tax=Perca fluviatilis TaxID=8168 RepID=A0A6A5EN54_PERFL|nr:hypothetical protein PFLUV_G00162230 [Perca fluviatilis]